MFTIVKKELFAHRILIQDFKDSFKTINNTGQSKQIKLNGENRKHLVTGAIRATIVEGFSKG